MFCGKCGAKNPDKAAFCSKCGAPLKTSRIQEDKVSEQKTLSKQKKNLIVAALGIFVILAIIFALKSCSGSTEDQLTGTWRLQEVNGENFSEHGAQIILGKDGTVYDSEDLLGDMVGSYDVIVSWSLMTDNQLAFREDAGGDKYILDFKISGNTLKLITDKYTCVFKRME